MRKNFFAAGFIVLTAPLAATADYNLSLNDPSGFSLTVNGAPCTLVDTSAGAPIRALSLQHGAGEKNLAITIPDGAQLACAEYTGVPPVSSSSASSVSSSSSSSSSSSGGDVPLPGVDLSSCGGSWPGNVYQGTVFNLAGVYPQAIQNLLGDNTVSFPIQTTIASGSKITFSVTTTATTASVNRDTWVSECPGGPAVDSNIYCSVKGTEALTLRASVGAVRSYCTLAANKQYFLNVKNTACGNGVSTNCGFYRNIRVD